MPRPEILEKIAEEQGTYVINLEFLDENDDPVVPNSINWTLTTMGGEVINDRVEVNVDTPAASVDILLYGPDLQLRSHKESYSWRIFTVKALYNSDLGSNLPLNKAARFKIRNLRLVANTLEIAAVEMVFIGENLDQDIV